MIRVIPAVMKTMQFAVIVSLFVLLPLPAVKAEDEKKDSWQMSMDTGQALMNKQRYASAISWYKRAAHEAQSFGDHGIHQAKALEMVSHCYEIRCDMKSAANYSQQAERIYSDAFQWQLHQPPVPDNAEGDWQTNEPALKIWLEGLNNLGRLVNLYQYKRQDDKGLSVLNDKISAMADDANIDPLLKAEALTIYQDWLLMLKKH